MPTPPHTLLRAKTADAQINEIRETISTGRRKTPMLSIRYTFAEADGTVRSEFDSVAVSWVPADAQTVKIQYLPGVDKSSRIHASERLMVVYFFSASVVWLGYSIFKIAREANTPIARGAGHRNR